VEGDVTGIPNSEKLDLVMLIHSLEHVINLDETIQQVSDRLSSEGLVFIEVPGIINYNKKNKHAISAMGLKSTNNFMRYLQYEHNYYFDLEHLNLIMERNGFEMLAGDEWVRAIFCRVSNKNNFVKNKVIEDKNNHMLDYLHSIENDYLSLFNLVPKTVRKMVCSNNIFKRD